MIRGYFNLRASSIQMEATKPSSKINFPISFRFKFIIALDISISRLIKDNSSESRTLFLT